MKKKIILAILSLFVISSLTGCIDYAKLNRSLHNKSNDIVIPIDTGVIKNNLSNIQERINKLEDYENILLRYYKNDKLINKVLNNKDNIYNSNIPNISFIYNMNITDSEDIIYYLYENTSKEWLPDILPEDILDINYEPESEVVKEPETEERAYEIIDIRDETPSTVEEVVEEETIVETKEEETIVETEIEITDILSEIERIEENIK